MLVRLGMPAAADPWSRAGTELEVVKPLSVLTTCTSTNPLPRRVAAGTSTVSLVGSVRPTGINGPPLTTPPEVEMNRLTSEPAVKFRPVMIKSPPTIITAGTLTITGVPGFGVGVAVGVCVGTGVGGRVGTGVGVGVGLGVEVGEG